MCSSAGPNLIRQSSLFTEALPSVTEASPSVTEALPSVYTNVLCPHIAWLQHTDSRYIEHSTHLMLVSIQSQVINVLALNKAMYNVG